MGGTAAPVAGGAITAPPAGAGEPVLSARGISKRYGGIQALDSVDLELYSGEVVALAGENGSGKSTLSKVIAGLVVPDAGTVECGGAPLSAGRPRASLDAGIALVSQELTAVPHLTVAENVLLHGLNRALSRYDRRGTVERAREFLEAVGLTVDPARTMGSLQPGDREMVEVAKALASRPKVLILDEATARLPDPERLFRVVEQSVAQGTAVVLITHRLPEIRRLASRAVVLRDGRLTGHLGRQELGDAEITKLMVGRDLEDFYHKRQVEQGATLLEVDGLVTDRSPASLSLSVGAGEIVGVAGLVGSGRSELLETIAGCRRRVRGSVRLSGRELTGRRPREAMERRLAFVPEDRFEQALVPGADLLANLSMPYWRMWNRTDRRGERSRATDAISRFRIRCDSAAAPVRSLSGGNAQKVVIARCLQQDPEVVVLDEPTRGVDVGARSDIYELLVSCAERGVGVLMASSDLMELIGLCDRVLVLHEGAIAGELRRDEMTEEAIALLALGGGAS